MTTISASMVKELRERTGLGMMECKKALQEADGDMDKAIELNPEYGAAFLSRANLRSDMGYVEEAAEDMEMAARLTEKNIQTFADENNVWRSRHLRLESEGILGEIDR